MRKRNLLLLGVSILSLGFALPTEARADHCSDPFSIYARYAREVVRVTFKGTDAMEAVVESAVPSIRRLQNAGEHARARAMAARAIRAIGSLGDRTHQAIRSVVSEGVEVLINCSGHVPPDVLRELISSLQNLGRRTAGYVADVEDDSVDAIKRLFPQISDVP